MKRGITANYWLKNPKCTSTSVIGNNGNCTQINAVAIATYSCHYFSILESDLNLSHLGFELRRKKKEKEVAHKKTRDQRHFTLLIRYSAVNIVCVSVVFGAAGTVHLLVSVTLSHENTIREHWQRFVPEWSCPTSHVHVWKNSPRFMMRGRSEEHVLNTHESRGRNSLWFSADVSRKWQICSLFSGTTHPSR